MTVKVDRAPALKVFLSVGAPVYSLQVLGRVSLGVCLALTTDVFNIAVQGNGIVTNIY